MTDRKIQQAIDACRPDDDLQSPEMDFLAEAVRNDPEVRRQYERSQQFDASVSGAFHEVPVPAGLGERLLAIVAARDNQPPVALSPRPCPRSPTLDASQDAEPQRRGPPRIRRRTWTALAGSLAAAAALVGVWVVSQYFGTTEPVADERLPGEIQAWTDAVVRQGWNDNLQAAELGRRPLDRSIPRIPRRWCQIATAYDAQTVVYDLAPPGSETAVVFCLLSKARTSALPDTPPWNAFAASGGLTLGVWRRGDMVYVLVVQGGPRRYREFIRTSPLIGFRTGSAIHFL
ncbi:MAG: DUF3379 domain-containing protein [Candidatus Anammoximicrobium sp.]|nr:DUF3379 domain-containing protein [Candidatus Anammoximicrobium sp.]